MLTPTEQKLVADNWGIIKREARRAYFHFRHHHPEDELISYASVKACELATRYKPQYGIPFPAFLTYRLQLSFIDYTRGESARLGYRHREGVVTTGVKPTHADIDTLIDVLAVHDPDFHEKDRIWAKFDTLKPRLKLIATYLMLGYSQVEIARMFSLTESRISQLRGDIEAHLDR